MIRYSLFICLATVPLLGTAQNVGIGTNAPAARLHVADSNVLFSGPLTLPANPGNPPASGAGARMMWYPRKAAFRSGYVESNQWDKDNIGPFSFATGVNTKASGFISTAMGTNTMAIGVASTALGSYTTAKAYAGIALGYLNDDADNPDGLSLGPNDRIFQLGNGMSNNDKRNAITVLRNGNVGIGTTTPGARLHVAESTVLFSGPAVLPGSPANPPASGAGVRMMWLSDRAAFRAGVVEASEWDDYNIGVGSAAFGLNPTATGEYSFASGGNSKSSGQLSVAMGYAAQASGSAAISLGSNSTAKGYSSIALGFFSVAEGNYSSGIARGRAYGEYSVALGGGIATGEYAVATGLDSKAWGKYSTAMGTNTIAYGEAGTALGWFTSTKAKGAIALGTYNDDADFADPLVPQSTDRIFQLGNGEPLPGARKNAITVLRNGNVRIGTTSPAALLHIAGTLQLQDGSQANNRVLTSDANGLASWKDLPANTSLWTAVGNDIYNANSGNVGVGTSTPANKLHVFNGASGFAGVHMRGMTLEGNQNSYFNILTNDISESAIVFGTATSPTGTSIHFNSSSLREGLEFRTGANNSRRMVITKTGSVGIGTAEPATPLHVKGSNGEALRLQSTDPFIGFYDNAGSYSGFLWANKLFGNDLRLGTPAGSLMPIVLAPNGNVALLASSLGNVGIGTITPAERLEVVAGPSATATKLVIGNKGGFGPAALEFVSDHGLSSQWRPGYIASNDNGNFTGKLEFFTNGTGSGNLYGSVKGLEVRNGATLTATGSVGSFSDERLKHNIEPFTEGLNVIEQINPVQFQYKPDAPFASPDKQVGIVAQDLEKVAPYMVHQTAEGNVKDMRWVDNQAYVFLLINAVKELTEQNKELKQQVKAAQKQLDVQHQMLQALISKYK